MRWFHKWGFRQSGSMFSLTKHQLLSQPLTLLYELRLSTHTHCETHTHTLNNWEPVSRCADGAIMPVHVSPEISDKHQAFTSHIYTRILHGTPFSSAEVYMYTYTVKLCVIKLLHFFSPVHNRYPKLLIHFVVIFLIINSDWWRGHKILQNVGKLEVFYYTTLNLGFGLL